MKKLSLLAAGLILLNGCIPVLIAGAGILTGFALGNDSATGNVKTEYRVLWDLCVDKMETLEAEVLQINESKGIIKAIISENSVTIRIDTINADTQRLKVCARKMCLPKPQFAQKIFFKIIDDL